MSINTAYSPDFDFKQFLRNIPSSQTKKQIDFTSVPLNSIDSFVTLLSELNNAVREKPLQISLEIILYLENFEEISKNFQYPIPLHRNLNIALKIEIDCSETSIFGIEETVMLQRIFSKFRLNVTLNVETADPEEIESVPFIINNFPHKVLDPLEVDDIDIE